MLQDAIRALYIDLMTGLANRLVLTLHAANVHDKRADNISEPIALLYLITTILNYYTTTLGTNYNYIRNS